MIAKYICSVYFIVNMCRSESIATCTPKDSTLPSYASSYTVLGMLFDCKGEQDFIKTKAR